MSSSGKSPFSEVVQSLRPGDRLEGVDLKKEIIGFDFSNCRIDWVRAKSVTFKGCKFHSTMFRDCYFHSAKFVECDFTGSKFINCNIRGVKIEKSQFDYCVIQNSQCTAEQFLNNLPTWENCRREFLRSLRKNAESIGEIDDVRKIFRAEMQASRAHWRNGLEQPTHYYKSHFPGIRGRFRALRKLVFWNISNMYWGFGESIWKLGFSTFLIYFVLSLWVQWRIVPHMDLSIWEFFLGTLSIALGNKNQISSAIDMHIYFSIVMGLMRIFTLGMFGALFLRSFTRR